jgi:hypothetical protein
MAFRTGDRVHQAAYGVGDIIDTNVDYITIAFDDGATRKFAAARVQLQRSNAPRPPRPAPKAGRRLKRATADGRPDVMAKGTAS